MEIANHHAAPKTLVFEFAETGTIQSTTNAPIAGCYSTSVS
jgi:hypothetical protein